MKEILEYLAQALVDEPDEVKVTEVPGERAVTLQLTVAPEDMGKVIGKRGRIVKAMRALLRATASRQGEHVFVEIVEA